MRLFDSHCHLQDERLAASLPDVMKKAGGAGVNGLLCCGTCETDWPIVKKLSLQYPALIPAFGLHPACIADRSSHWLKDLSALLQKHPGAGIGEIGLDHAVDERHDAEQRTVFMDQMRLAVEFQRPSSVHCRRAWAALLECIGSLGRLPAGFVIHSYSGSSEMIAPLQAAGAYFSFSGSITRPTNRRGHQSAQAVPLDRLLIETDAPDLMPLLPGPTPLPESRQGQRINEPANLVLVLTKLAELRGMSPAELAEPLWNNALTLWGSAIPRVG